MRTYPLQRFQVKEFVWDKAQSPTFTDWIKAARDKCDTEAPSLIGVEHMDSTSEFQRACVGFQSRRTSHTAEIRWWGGDHIELLTNGFITLVWLGILEGRKRLEMFWPVDPDYPTNVKTALQLAGFKYEGTHPEFDDLRRDNECWSHVWLEDGIPSPLFSLQDAWLILSKKSLLFREKNLKLYSDDIDLYRKNKNGRTFATNIEEAIDTVMNLGDQVRVEEILDWHGSERKWSLE